MRSLRCPRRKRPTPPTLVAIVVLFCSRASCRRQSACARTARRRPAGRASRTSSWGMAQRFSMLLRQTSLLTHRRSQNLALMMEVCANAALKPALSPIHARPLRLTRVLRVPVQLCSKTHPFSSRFGTVRRYQPTPSARSIPFAAAASALTASGTARRRRSIRVQVPCAANHLNHCCRHRCRHRCCHTRRHARCRHRRLLCRRRHRRHRRRAVSRGHRGRCHRRRR